MTVGALIFAYNNEAFDYVRMAAWTAQNIRRHLGIPVAVVTDRPTDLDFDRVIIHAVESRDSRWFVDANQRAAWHNQTRADAYDLTPWDRTLLIDADYVVASHSLKVMLDLSDQSVLCHRGAWDVTGMNDFHALNHLGRYQWPLCWATVVVFNRDQHAKIVFDCMRMIRDNWSHYRQIYHEPSAVYRNDHSLTIALNIANGHWPEWPVIPWSLATVLPEHQVTRVGQDCYRVDFQRSDNRPAWLEIAGQDFHAMGKRSIMDMLA